MSRAALHWLRLRGELILYLVALGVAISALGYCALSFGFAPAGTDFRLYYASALVAQKWGFPHLYDFELQSSAVRAVGLGAFWQPYINPPTLTIAVLPFTALPFLAARLLWSLLLLAAFGAGWWFSGVGRGRRGQLLGLAFLCWFPSFFSLLIGQPAFLVGGALVIAVHLCRPEAGQGRRYAAGALLAAAVSLKPQLGLLIPLALLVGREGRVLIGFTAAGGGLALMSLALLGPGGIHAWLSALQVASSWSIGRAYSLPANLGGGWLGAAAQLLVITLIVLAGLRRRSLPGLLTAGVLGSLLVSPYVSLQDFAVLCFPVWLAVAGQRTRFILALVVLLWLAGAYSQTVGPALLLFVLLGWLGWLAAAPQGDVVQRGAATGSAWPSLVE